MSDGHHPMCSRLRRMPECDCWVRAARSQVFVVSICDADSPNDPGSGVVGVFSTRERADDEAGRYRTGWVEAFDLDGSATSDAPSREDRDGLG